MTTFEPDQDLTAANAPTGFTWSADEEQIVDVDEATEFPGSSYDDVNGLLNLGYLTSNVEIFGHKFVLRTLKRGERLEVTLVTKKWEETLGLAIAWETALVAASIVTVDGVPLAQALGPNHSEGRIAAAFQTVNDWFEPVVDALHWHYTELVKRQQAAFASLLLK